ncbi:MFS transporter [Neolewinella lacunae]|uniref:MFS transporter n=1 Tax=Neolewinella lacunae TaxID=1517758 RepID=A0A923T8R6_9BACT|nr:MFS transporter [Neolewinella lacunae]MBC6995920.1 MFS transporter [Neolewinella lacunae]MDN3635237.1 MFS transporter [Neolewinella lacunae]
MSTTTTRTYAEIPANRDRLFLASCFALIVTSMTFAIRAGILPDLAAEFGLSDQELGWVNSMAFYGFPLAMLVGGAIYNTVGPKVLMWLAFVSHLLGLVLTMTAGGFWGLIISTFLIGFANGSVEAACNPLIADMYPDKQTQMLNKFHVWFPGGIVIGSLVAFFLGGSVSWQVLIATMFIPTAIYGFLILGQPFPKGDNIVSNTAENIKGILTPLFIIIALIMTVTATTEFGTTQWVERILSNAGANAMILLALTAGIMATGRFFAGPLIHSFNPVGVLIGSAVLSCLGLFILSSVTGPMIYVGTAVFGLGICYFWPTMLGFTAEYLPKSGAFGLSLIGGAGMLGAGIWNPIIGGWIDSGRETALANGLTGEAAELATGQAALGSIAMFPLVLIFVFVGLYFYMRGRMKGDSAAEVVMNPDAMRTPGSAR